MIHIRDLKGSDVGRWVVYRDRTRRQEGRIKTWNDHFIFVVYTCNDQWDRFLEFSAWATHPEDLEFKE